MTTIAINAVSIREGGALVVLRELLLAMALLRPDWQWVVITNLVARRQLPELGNTIFHVVGEGVLRSWRIRGWYETVLPRLLLQADTDLLFSQTNYLPWRRVCCPTLLLVQHAGHFSPLFKSLTEAQLKSPLARLAWRMKGHWVRSSVRKAAAVTVQTHALAKVLGEDTGVSAKNITVIPHGCGLIKTVNSDNGLPAPGQPLRIGYITKYGVQKNFLVLFKAIAILHEAGIPVQLVLTLDVNTNHSQQVLLQARQLGIADLIDNNGELNPPGIERLYQSLHLFVFASLCESFGFPQLEAMACGLPLLIADTSSNREIAGNAGLLFAPADSEALAEKIERLSHDDKFYQQQSQLSRTRAAAFSWQKSAMASVQLIESILMKAR